MVRIDLNIDPKKYFPDTKHIIEYAFSLGDFHYFKYHDAFNIPAERALSTIAFYREVELNCDRAYLQAHSEAVINCLSPTKERPTIEAGQALQLERQLLLRMNLPKDTDLMYKLCSAVFFDQKENPVIYEFSYAVEKIKRWKQEATLKDFFLQMPITSLIPYLQSAEQNLNIYDQIVKEVNHQHLAIIREHLSSEQLTKFNASREWLQAATLKN